MATVVLNNLWMYYNYLISNPNIKKKIDEFDNNYLTDRAYISGSNSSFFIKLDKEENVLAFAITNYIGNNITVINELFYNDDKKYIDEIIEVIKEQNDDNTLIIDTELELNINYWNRTNYYYLGNELYSDEPMSIDQYITINKYYYS